jgi:hypothetical protein
MFKALTRRCCFGKRLAISSVGCLGLAGSGFKGCGECGARNLRERRLSDGGHDSVMDVCMQKQAENGREARSESTSAGPRRARNLVAVSPWRASSQCTLMATSWPIDLFQRSGPLCLSAPHL